MHRTILTRFWAQSSGNLRHSSDELRDCLERFRVISPKEVRKRRRGFDHLWNTRGDRLYSLHTILFESGCSLHSYYNFITTLKTTMLLVNQNAEVVACILNPSSCTLTLTAFPYINPDPNHRPKGTCCIFSNELQKSINAWLVSRF